MNSRFAMNATNTLPGTGSSRAGRAPDVTVGALSSTRSRDGQLCTKTPNARCCKRPGSGAGCSFCANDGLLRRMLTWWPPTGSRAHFTIDGLGQQCSDHTLPHASQHRNRVSRTSASLQIFTSSRVLLLLLASWLADERSYRSPNAGPRVVVRQRRGPRRPRRRRNLSCESAAVWLGWRRTHVVFGFLLA